jgi:hypothetical protein
MVIFTIMGISWGFLGILGYFWGLNHHFLMDMLWKIFIGFFGHQQQYEPVECV